MVIGYLRNLGQFKSEARFPNFYTFDGAVQVIHNNQISSAFKTGNGFNGVKDFQVS